MCISDEYIQILSELNERDFRSGRASLETYTMFQALFERCHACERRGNGAYGDVLFDCREDFLRLFLSMKADAERYLISGPLPDAHLSEDADDAEAADAALGGADVGQAESEAAEQLREGA